MKKLRNDDIEFRLNQFGDLMIWDQDNDCVSLSKEETELLKKFLNDMWLFPEEEK